MRARTRSKFLAMLVTSILLSLALYSMLYSFTASQGALGKQAYLQSQDRRFDRFYSQPRVLLTARFIVAGCAVPALGIVASIALYEFLGFGIYRLLRPDKTEGDATRTI